MSTMNVDAAVNTLTAIRNQLRKNRPGLGGNACLLICVQGIPYVEVEKIIVDYDDDGAVVLVMPDNSQMPSEDNTYPWLSKLIELVQKMHNKPHYHKTRGFSLNEATPAVASHHTVEESLELEGEVLFGKDPDKVRSEAADMMGSFLHLLYMLGMDIEIVCQQAIVNLNEKFVDDPLKVETDTPGITRSARSKG